MQTCWTCHVPRAVDPAALPLGPHSSKHVWVTGIYMVTKHNQPDAVHYIMRTQSALLVIAQQTQLGAAGVFKFAGRQPACCCIKFRLGYGMHTN